MNRHYMTGTRVHRAWIEMRRRCRATRHRPCDWIKYKDISVCEEWDRSFMDFYDYVLPILQQHFGPRTKDIPKGYDMHRIDSHGDYEPGNISFVPHDAHGNHHLNGADIPEEEWCF